MNIWIQRKSLSKTSLPYCAEDKVYWLRNIPHGLTYFNSLASVDGSFGEICGMVLFGVGFESTVPPSTSSSSSLLTVCSWTCILPITFFGYLLPCIPWHYGFFFWKCDFKQTLQFINCIVCGIFPNNKK